ncbi:MAG: riboflavin synthase [Acidobacteriota bacterium]
MFTGLVRERGRILSDPTPSNQGGVRLHIDHSRALGADFTVGASLAVSGVCLTLLETVDHPDPSQADRQVSAVELAPETLRRTVLGALRAGDEVNLEPSLRLGDELGGHWVQGHVDDVLEIVAREDFGEHRELGFALPAGHRPLVVPKGSVALDGTSLTVAQLAVDRFTVALIPHTLDWTTFGARAVGDRVHVEFDVLGKYVQRLLAGGGAVDGPWAAAVARAAAGDA